MQNGQVAERRETERSGTDRDDAQTQTSRAAEGSTLNVERAASVFKNEQTAAARIDRIRNADEARAAVAQLQQQIRDDPQQALASQQVTQATEGLVDALT